MALDLEGQMDAFSPAEIEGPGGQEYRWYMPVAAGLNFSLFQDGLVHYDDPVHPNDNDPLDAAAAVAIFTARLSVP